LRHDLTSDGYAFRLRPVREEDTDFILGLRTDQQLNRFIHATSSDAAAHLAWLSAYYERPGDFYFIVERRDTQEPQGTISLYGIDEVSRSAEWGRWVMKTGSLGAVESAWLLYRLGFEYFSLDTIFSRTIRDNTKVVSFHDSCGCFQRGTTRIGAEEFIEHELTRSDWLVVGPELERKARRIGGLIHV
jgi:RimJ/RimL family protein N-acetyltransferase